MIAASDTLTISYDSGFWVILPFIIFGIIALSFMAGWFAALGRIEKDKEEREWHRQHSSTGRTYEDGFQ